MCNKYNVIHHTMVAKMCLILGFLTTGCIRNGDLLGMESMSRQRINIEQCDNCGVSSSDCKFCARCKSVRYCGKACQRAHWRGGHREQCQLTNAPLPSPDISIGMHSGLPRSTIGEVILVASPPHTSTMQEPLGGSVGDGPMVIGFVDAPYKKVELSDVQNRFLNDFMQILNREDVDNRNALLKAKGQEVFDYFKSENTPAASMAAKRALITILDVIKFEKNPREWNSLNWAFMGVGDEVWRYLP